MNKAQGNKATGAALDSEKWAGWKRYDSLNELGETPGSETMENICAKMQNKSELNLEINFNHNSAEYPSQFGILHIIRHSSSRCVATFLFKDASRIYNGAFAVDIIPKWTGWRETAQIESGMWQPTFRGATVAGNMQVEVTYKDYHKNGKIISCSLLFKVKASGGATGDLIIGALPVPMASGGFVADFYAMPAAFAGAKLAAITNGTTSQLIIRSGAQTVKADNAALVSDSPWCINFIYRGA